jgi:hypothetical protein
MPNLFGLDIAKLVNDTIQKAGGVLDGTLSKVVNGARAPGDITAGPSTTVTEYSFKGFIENKTEVRRSGTLVASGGKFVSMLGGSLPSGIEPMTGDLVTIENIEYKIIEVAERDPAAALYVLRVEV